MISKEARMHNDLSVTDLVIRARKGDKQAWDVIVERYSPLIQSICRRYQVDYTDANDIGQNVWLYLVDKLATIRDPAALPGWLATTTKRECSRALRATRWPHMLQQELHAENIPGEQIGLAEHELLMAERHTTLREAFARLPLPSQRLLALLVADPPVPYTEISARLGIPVGSIGPNRSRSLDRLRRDPAIAALINAEAAS